MFIRGMASLLCLVCMLNLCGRFHGAKFDATIWWLDLRLLPAWLGVTVEVASILAFAIVAAGERAGVRARRIAGAIFALLAIVEILNAMNFFRISAGGEIRSTIGLPLSSVLALLLATLVWRTASSVRGGNSCNGWWRLRFVAGFATVATVMPLVQMLFFGTTDYRRQADAIVVFGAAVDESGRPSLALADRVETACRLYQEGRAPLLIFSGGPGPGAVDEANTMRNLAIHRGVPSNAILLDHAGITTDATVRNTSSLLNARGAKRVLAVSHAYHLPRVKLAYQSAGRDVYTVPARESRTLARMPYYIARETAAMWFYYGRSILRG